MTMQTFTPLEYLKLDIASNYGLDKESWNDRLDWFKTIEPLIHPDRVTDINSNGIFQALTKDADEPALFHAGCLAYRAAVKGESISYPISLDATASGAQILSVLTGCRKSAALCNVVDTGNREDLYTNVHDFMNDRLETAQGVKRAAAKQAVMTALYGSTKEPRKAFGEGERLDAFYRVMTEELPGIWELNQNLLELADPTAEEYSWVLPDNFNVRTKVMTTVTHNVEFCGDTYHVPQKIQGPIENDLSLGANTTHSIDGMIVREILRRCYFDANQVTDIKVTLSAALYAGKTPMAREKDQMVITLWDHYLQSGFLSARILEVLDKDNLWWVDKDVILGLINSMPRSPFPVLAVHDCFRVHPNYGNDLRLQYNQILSEIAGSNLLGFIVTQIAGEVIVVDKFSDLAPDVLEANYALS